jgi:hypothetical protein
MGDFQSALEDWLGHSADMKNRYGGGSLIDEYRNQSNLDDVYAVTKLKYQPSVDEEVERLASERVNSRAPGPGGAALSPDQWRAYFGEVVPQQRAAQVEQQQFDATRTPVNRLLSADAFAVSAPIRMLTGGKYGASNLLEVLPAYQGLAPAFAKGEADFARANEGALETAAQAGESAMALPGLQELGAVEGGIAGTLKAMRNTRTANALNRLLPTVDDASRTMGMSGATSKASSSIPMDEASRMSPRQDDLYLRRTPRDDPMSKYGYAMFKRADGDHEHVLEQLGIYGKNSWVGDVGKSIKADEIAEDAFASLQRRGLLYPAGKHGELPLSAADIASDINPTDIVNGAGAWDNPDWVKAIYEDVLAPRGIESVMTSDGMISFAPQNIRRFAPIP